MAKLYSGLAYLCGSAALALLAISVVAGSGQQAWGVETVNPVVIQPVEEDPELGTCASTRSTPCLANDWCEDDSQNHISCSWAVYTRICSCPK